MPPGVFITHRGVHDKYGNLVHCHISRSTGSHRVGGNRKRYQQSTNVDQKSIETVFSIAICRQCGDKWQSKTLFLRNFYLRSSIVLAFSIGAYLVCGLLFYLYQYIPVLTGFLQQTRQQLSWLLTDSCW